MYIYIHTCMHTHMHTCMDDLMKLLLDAISDMEEEEMEWRLQKRNDDPAGNAKV